jgi:hypothetical protein
MDGNVYAEPLVDTGLTIANGVNTTPGAAGVHDVVFVATEHDSLYAIDTGTGAVLWKRVFLSTTNSGGNINSTLGATAITSIPSGGGQPITSDNVTPEVGITGTPVIDASTSTIYLVTKTKETVSGTAHYVQRLHAISITDGTDRAAPYLIGDTTGTSTYTNSTPIYVYGSGDGHVTDPYNGTGRQVVQFNALREHQRGALNLVNNSLYVQWASHGDEGPYHGWVARWDVTNVLTTGFVLTGALNTSPNNGLSGIWQGSGRLVFEPDSSAFYFVTGNGSGGAPTIGADGFPTNANYNEAVVKVVNDGTTTATSQGANGWGMKVADYFIPYNVVALDNADSDFGSGGLMIPPDMPGAPHMLLASGKAGQIYVINRDNMGHYNATNDAVLNAVPNGAGHNTAPNLISGSLSTPAYFNGKIYWVSGYSGRAYSYTLNSAGTIAVSSQTSVSSFGYLPGSVIVSADGTSNGVVWVMDAQSNLIHAYDASTMATELWNSNQRPAGSDALGAVIKFAVPTVANGEVFVGTSNSLVVYGLTAPPNAVPNQPTLTATPLSGSVINLTWTDTTTAPNLATSYVIQYSLDGTNFSTAATASAGSTSLAMSGLQPSTKYYFRVYGVNSLGPSAYSTVVNATTTASLAGVDFSSGFIGAGAKLTLNGAAAVSGTALQLTNGTANQTASVFTTSPFDVTKFNTNFTFNIAANNNTADGFTFCIQGAGPTALGGGGGLLGYAGINNSVAIKFDLYSNAGEGTNSTGLYTNGATPFNVGSLAIPTATSVDLHSGHSMNVSLSYDGTTLNMAINDPTANRTYTHSWTIGIPGTIGSSTGYVGFTGGSGGSTAIQNILTWTYVATSSGAPNSNTLLYYPAGLVGATSQLTVNGAAALGPTSTVGDLRLTSGAGNQTSSAFTTAPIDITKFTTQFTFMLSGGAGIADGFTFCIQRNGPTALGAGGGYLAYQGINNSVALKFDLYNNNGEGTDSTGLYINGAAPFNVGSVDLSGTAINLLSGDPINVVLVYDGTTLTESISDPVVNATVVETYTINIPATVGGNTAYVGFTGATGGSASTQNIMSWTYTLPVVSPNAPSALGGSPATATSIGLNWTNNAANQSGFHLDRATDAAFTQNLVTQTLPATPFTFTDSAIGLAPGSSYYYRIRAFNSAGDSGNSNAINISIPVAPPKPSNQSITDVTTTEIDIVWQDNAGHAATEYDILRAVNHGSFLQVATLPPTSRTPPSEYGWSDTGLTPGNYYEYHIEAVNSSGNNDFAGVNATTITQPPSGLSALTVGSTIQLSWTAPTGATTYNVYRSTTSGGESGNLLAAGIATTNYTDSSAVAGATYYYEVTSENGNDTYTPPLDSESDFSSEVSAIGPGAEHAQWTPTAGSSWNTVSAWTDVTSGTAVAPPGLRGVAGDTVLFGAAGGSPVRLDGTSPAVAMITLDNNTINYTILQGSGGTLGLNNGSNNALITVAHGSHTISAPVLLSSNLSIAPASGTSLTLSGAIAGAGKSLTVNGQGVVVLSGANSNSGGTVVLSGKLAVTNSNSLLDGSSLTVGNWMAPASVVPASIATAASAVVFASPVTSGAHSPTLMATPRWPRHTAVSGSVGPMMAASRRSIGLQAADKVIAGRTSAALIQRGAAINSSWLNIPTDNKDRVLLALDAVLARYAAASA